MNTIDSRIHCERLHNQDLFIPTLDSWLDILKIGTLNELAIPTSDLISCWLKEYTPFQEAKLSLVLNKQLRWSLIPLLQLHEGTFRVHYENVICEHCEQRNGPSATPDTTAYAGTGYSHEQIWKEFSVLPVKSCKFCGNILRRRQTIWMGEKAIS